MSESPESVERPAGVVEHLGGLTAIERCPSCDVGMTTAFRCPWCRLRLCDECAFSRRCCGRDGEGA